MAGKSRFLNCYERERHTTFHQRRNESNALKPLPQNEYQRSVLSEGMGKFTSIASVLVLLGSGGSLSAIPAANAMAFQCFDRSSGEQVAESDIDISSPAIRCLPADSALETSRSAPIDPFAAKRALNLARGTAVALNGGLSQYRPSSCMFRSAAGNPCLTRSDGSGIEFTIPGGKPGWEEYRDSPSVLNVVLIAPDGRSVLQSN